MLNGLNVGFSAIKTIIITCFTTPLPAIAMVVSIVDYSNILVC